MSRNPLAAAAAAAAVLIMGVVLPATINAVPVQSDATISRSFDVGAGGTLEVSAAFGSIEITTASGNHVDVRVVREVRDRYDDDDAQILAEHRVEMSQDGDNLTVRADVGDDARERWNDEYRNTPLRVRLEIAVPSSYNVDLETRGGNISVADLDGEVRADTSGGNLEFGNISGTVWGRTSGGNVTLERSSATVEVRTSGGNIEIGDVEGRVDAETSGGSIRVERAGGEVHVETSGGNITVDDVAGAIDAHSSGGNVTANISRQPASDCRLSTSAGSVTVTVASGIGLEIDASTSIGGVSSDFAVDGRVARNSIRGAINGGGPELRLRTSAGSIRIRER